MTISFSLSGEDFLQHQLFAASKSARITKKRRRSWLLATSLLLIFALLFYRSGNILMLNYCLVLVVVTLLFYPAYLKTRYKKHYQSFISENYKNRFGKTVTLNFRDDHIESIDDTGDSKIKFTAVEKIYETREYFYLTFNTAESIILPKEKISDNNLLRNELQRISKMVNAEFVNNLGWKW